MLDQLMAAGERQLAPVDQTTTSSTTATTTTRPSSKSAKMRVSKRQPGSWARQACNSSSNQKQTDEPVRWTPPSRNGQTQDDLDDEDMASKTTTSGDRNSNNNNTRWLLASPLRLDPQQSQDIKEKETGDDSRRKEQNIYTASSNSSSSETGDNRESIGQNVDSNTPRAQLVCNGGGSAWRRRPRSRESHYYHHHHNSQHDHHHHQHQAKVKDVTSRRQCRQLAPNQCDGHLNSNDGSYNDIETVSVSKSRPLVVKTGPTATAAALVCCLFIVVACSSLIVQLANSYQLTNNMIANNLPPKFVVQSSSTNGNGGVSSSTTTNSEIVVRVKEGPQSIGKLIYTLKGDDPDDDPLTFGVLGTMASELLRVENVPGNQANVYLRKELDRETTESHQVVITLTDGKLGRGNWITKSMLIIVEDVNDNYPVFGPHRTAISIREDARAPLVIETIEASDADEGRFGQVIYKLDESAAAVAEQPGGETAGNRGSSAAGGGNNAGGAPTIGQMFQIDTIDGRGVISLIGQLDFEQRPLYQLRVLAIDRAQENERLSTSTSILISVEDCEDQPPMFTFAPSITRIPEDLPVGSTVLRVSATDGDRGVNNPIKYSLVSVNNQETGYERNLFSIGSDSGQISVAHDLDRELTMDNNSPRSSSSTNSNSVSSNQPGAYVLQVRATEVSQTSSAGGLLDGLFSSSASSSPSSANSVTTELTVILIDVNDELPTFNQEKYYGEILENSPAESLVSFVQAPSRGAEQQQKLHHSNNHHQQQQLAGAKVFDRDQGTNGTFTLHLEGEHGHLFDVWPSEATNEATLMIKVSAGAALQPANAKYFDYEQTKELRLTLVAREKFPPPNGGPRRQSTAEMIVQLRDTNDNYPQFDTDLYRVEIPENAIRGMHICAVKATDLDSGPLGSAGVRYTEIRGERANNFKLDPMTGVITLKTNEHGFDREQTAQHHLIVEARDNLGLGNRNTTQLMIVLTDVNDQRPKFLLDQYEAFIYENELDFQSPLQVQASDLDAPNTQNSRLTYSIVGGDPQRNFTIDPLTGRIRVRATLVAAAAPASSPMSTGSASVLGDFDSTTTISDNRPPQANVLQATGLDFERIPQKRDETRQFNLTIRASDNGLPEPLSSTTQVVVVVYDKNDHAPVFSRPIYARSIREDAPGGSAVIQVQAQDGDHSPVNSKITYRISSGASDKFVIDSDTGLISVANGANLDIDRVQGGGQRRTGYLLNVLASDGSFGQNQKSSSALVNITIIDVNNKAPEFLPLNSGANPAGLTSGANNLKQQFNTGANQQQQQQSVVFVNEDAPYGLIVTRVFATDLDSSAELRFSINYARSEARNEDMILVEPSVYRDVFSIDPLDGTIKVNKQLDRELFDQVKLRLQVEDLAAQTPDQVAYSHLLIKITDINDNRPTFKRPIYKAVVNENSISGTSVITMAADDRDLNKTLRYSLEASSPELARLVRINPRSGEVTVNDKIDRELFPLINITIKAEDFGQPHSLTGSAQLIITVRDENDNNPIFLNATHLRPMQARPDHTFNGQSSGGAGSQVPSPNNHNMNYRSSSSGASSYRLRSLGPHQAQLPPSVSGRFLTEQDQPPILELTDEMTQHHPETSYFGLLAAPSDENGRELALLAPGSTAQVSEDSQVGHQIAYVRAEDADVGNNGRVTYLLDPNSNSDGKFRIDRDSGILSVAQPLDREHQKHYTLIIEACDNFDLGYSTGESRRAFTQVNIQVTDINDNAPIISTNLHQAHSSSSSASPLSSVGNSGSSSASAAAAASSPVSSYPTYEDAINSPGPYELPLAECLLINEFQALNEPILVVSAIDPDDPDTPNGQMDLAIINNVHQNEMFSLVPIRSGGANNGASNNQQLLGGNEPVTITSTTTGRSPNVAGLLSLPPPPLPTITSPTSAAAASGADGLTGLGEDQPSSSAEFRFRPQESRANRARRSMDNIRLAAEPSPRSLTIQQHHRPLSSVSSSSRYATPTTTDVPASQIVRSAAGTLTSLSAAASAPVGTTTTRLSLSSQQPGQQQQISSIGGGELQMHLVVSQSLKEKVGNYSILVRATDRGSPSLSSVKLINVCVQDVNNHAPVFTRPPLNHTIRIMENATIGSFVTQVEATDFDHGLNGELQYSLKPTNIQNNNNDWQSFKIDRLTGTITTTKLFNRQLKRYYTLRVQAQDLGRPTSLSSDIDINIMIVNSGKYQPEFEQQQQSVQFTENVAPGVEWFKLLQTTNLEDDPALIHMNQLDAVNSKQPTAAATGASNNNNNWLSSPCYYIVDGDDHEQVFHLDRYTHKLTNQKELDREKRANYTLIVQASNNCNGKPAVSHRLLGRQSSQLDDETLAAVTTTTSTTTSSSLLAASGSGDGMTVSLATTGNNNQRLRRELGFSSKPQDSLLTNTRQTNNIRQGKRAKDEQQQPSSEKLISGELSPVDVQTLDSLVASDKSLLKVSIKIKDVNDNAPKFTQRTYTGGITTEADFGTVFMIVQAIDADSEANGQVTYSIVKPIKRNLSLQQSPLLTTTSTIGISSSSSSLIHQQQQQQTTSSAAQRQRRSPSGGNGRSGEESLANGDNSSPLMSTTRPTSTIDDQQPPQNNQPTGTANNYVPDLGGPSNELNWPQLAENDDLFVVNAVTGEISLNFDPQKQMKGYFEFDILAKDADGLSDSARVLIYLLRQDQRVKFVLRLTPQELRQRLNRFRSVFGNITGALVNIDSYKYYENHDGTVDKKKTSLYLHFVQPEDNTIIEVDKVLTLIDNNIEYLDELYKEFHVLSSEAAHLPLSSGALVDPIDQVRTSLMGISSFLALILVLVIALCLNQRTRYERQLKAAAVSAFGGPPLHLDPDFHSTTNLPNTNLHSQDPNPIWINGHHYSSGGHANANHQLLGDQGVGSNDHHHGHWTSNISSAASADCTKIAPGGTKSIAGGRLDSVKTTNAGTKGSQKQLEHQQQQQKLFHSASSGVGMTLDDDDDDELDELSTSGGDQSDMNSLNGVVSQHNHTSHNHHHHHHHYGAATAATATPRDSLSSSHGQVSSSGSSSGANSASTTNERQVLCSGTKRQQLNKTVGGTRGEPKTIHVNQVQQQQQQPSGKGSSSHHLELANNNSNTNTITGNNSTFGGAYKEVTIYTEHQQRASKSFGGDNTKRAPPPIEQKPAIGGQQHQQQATSQTNRLNASQFSSSRLQQIGQQRQSIYVSTNESGQQQAGGGGLRGPHQNQGQNQGQQKQHNQQKARIAIHSNGTSIEQGIIKAGPNSANHHQGSATNKQLFNKLDAKFVPVNDNMNHHQPGGRLTNNNAITSSQQQQQQLQQQQDQSVNNFETSLSKLSILNLETTEL